MADGSVIIDTELDQSGLNTGLASLGTSLVGGITKAVAAAGAALLGLGTYAVKTNAEFDAAISGVAATMGTTKDQITDITAKAKELGATTEFTATQAAEGFNILAQSGLAAADQLSTIPSVLDLASAGEMSMGDAAGYITSTMKAMSVEMDAAGKNAAYVADLYAKGATLANTSTAEFGEAMTSAASVAGSYNQSLETTGTALLALAEKHYAGSVAGTYLSRAMSDIYAPTANASKALQELGVSAYDSAGNQRDFIEVVNDLNAAFSDMTEEEKAAYAGSIFTTAGLKAFNAIAGNSSEELSNLTSKLEDCNGAAHQMAETKLDNLHGDIIKLSSAADGFANDLGEVLTTGIRPFVQEGTSLINQLHDALLDGGFNALGASVGDALAQAVQMISGYIPKLVSIATDLISSFVQGISKNAGTVADIAVQIGSSLLDGILSIAVDLHNLGAQLIISLANALSENAYTIVDSLSSGLMQIATTILGYIPDVVAAGTQLLFSLVDAIIGAAPALIETVPTILEQVITAVMDSSKMLLECVSEIVLAIAEMLPEVISSIINVLPSIIQQIANAITTFIPMIANAGVQLLTGLISNLPAIVTTICFAMPGLVNSIASAILGMVPTIVNAGVQLLVSLVQNLPEIIYNIVLVIPVIIASIIDSIIALIPEIIQCGIELLTSLVSALPQIIVTIVAVIPAIIASIISALIDSIPLIIQCGIQLLTSLIGALPEIIVAIVAAIPQIITSIINAIISNIPLIINAGIQLLTSLITALPQIISTVIRAVPQIAQALVSGFRGTISQFVSAGSAMLQGIGSGIANAVGSVVAKAVEAAKRILQSVKNFFGIASPSRVMRDLIGKNLMLGLADGIVEMGYAAVDAAQDVADDIADIDYNIDPSGIDYDGLAEGLRATVQVQGETTAAKVSASSAAVQGSGDDQTSDQPQSGGKPEYVENNIYIDGKKTARVITPYVSKELAWEG